MIIYTVQIDSKFNPIEPAQKIGFEKLTDAYDYARNYMRNQGDGSEMCVIRKEDITVIDSFRV